jgi:site-specific DNA-methyltransferase (adenine-specific)
VAENVLKYGTGGINIDGCRVGINPGYKYNADKNGTTFGSRIKQTADKRGQEFVESTQGRFPANIIHDGSDEVLKCFPETSSGAIKAGTPYNHSNCKTMGAAAGVVHSNFAASNGSAARFYYCAKASPSERGNGNTHPTVKPVDLIKYLVKLVCPRNGTVLDPFAGSCTTGWAAHELGMNYILIDKDAESVAIGRNRLKRENAQLNMFLTNRR